MGVHPDDNLFDKSQEYEEMLNRGLRLSGESKDFFMEGRVRDACQQLASLGITPRRILDFGCGTGETSRHFAKLFPEAEVMGVDNAANALDHARRRYGSDRVRFGSIREFRAREQFDFCYVNGVFHHISPPQRLVAVRLVWQALVRGGRFALMENNPWNLGTRLVMSRIPFDRDAIPLTPLETRRLLREGGFEQCAPTRYLFIFPRPLAFLRFMEPWFARLPLGAQYYVLATKT